MQSWRRHESSNLSQLTKNMFNKGFYIMTTGNFKKELKALLNKYNATIESMYDEYDDDFQFIGWSFG